MNFIKDFILGMLFKIFPFLQNIIGYKGVVNTQIAIYKRFKKFKKEHSEQDILNYLLWSRARLSQRDIGSDDYYKDLVLLPNKTLEQVIGAIVEWEFLLSPQRKSMIADKKIPINFVENYLLEIRNYVKKRVNLL